MVWTVTTERDYGMGTKPVTTSKYTTDAYRSVQAAAFRSCEDPGEHCRVTIVATNNEGLTLRMEGMGWTAEGLRDYEDVCLQAYEHSMREGVL